MGKSGALNPCRVPVADFPRQGGCVRFGEESRLVINRDELTDKGAHRTVGRLDTGSRVGYGPVGRPEPVPTGGTSRGEGRVLRGVDSGPSPCPGPHEPLLSPQSMRASRLRVFPTPLGPTYTLRR